MTDHKRRWGVLFLLAFASSLHAADPLLFRPTLAGPWKGISEPFTVSWSEGPSVAKVGGEYIVYYDHYRDSKRYQAARSPDLEHWTPITERVQFPADCKHGSLLRITAKERKQIEAAQ